MVAIIPVEQNSRMLPKVSIGFARAIIVAIGGSMFAGIGRLLIQEGGMVYTIVLASLLLVAVIAVAITTRGCKDDTAMPPAQRWLLLSYLLSIGACLVYLIAALGSADFPDATTTVSSGAATRQSTPTDAPVLMYVFPESLVGSPSDLSLVLYGKNFHDGAVVQINSKEHATKLVEKGTLLSVPLQQSDLSGVSSLTVAIVNPDDNKTSNPLIVSVARPRVTLSTFGFHTSLTRELQLLLLIIFAGALGSYVTPSDL